jgi:hypothetical protein
VGLRGIYATATRRSRRPTTWRPRVVTSDETSAEALRQRRYAARQRNGRVVVPVEVEVEDLELLIAAGVLSPEGLPHTREAIGEAIASYLKISADA